jgi:hypothetical protein
MAKKPAIHTVPTDKGWANRTEGASRTFGSAPTKAKAEATGRASAKSRGVEQISHRKNGTIGERRSYGPDPYPPTG